ncbi:MAG: sigma-70 family RNA polymerase sigma factor [Verrucomicrobiota bacterium]|jgi:RNA polymerase sigma-70 factor (ECF subfamily)
MIPATDSTALNAGRNAQFTTTHWSAVLAARQADSPAATAALERLCQTYWYPLYAFVRRQGNSPEDAQDVTQEFFARVLQKDYFAQVDQSKGRFRDFLKAALRHFLADCRDRGRALKRGGGKPLIHLDALTAEERYRLEPADTMTPDRSFDRSWALTAMQHAIAGLREKYAAEGKGEFFEYLKPYLAGSEKGLSQAEIALRLGKSEEAIKSEVFRLRRHFAQCLRAEIQHTVAGVSDIDEEARYLLEVWSDNPWPPEHPR